MSDTTKTVDFDGEEYTVAKEVLDDVEVLEAWEDGKHATLCRLILGADQWKKFKSKKRSVTEMYEVITLALKDDEDEAAAE